jgi:MSHA pilin protein MshD
MCTRPMIESQRGISLIELIMFIVIVSASLAGILGVMNLVTRHSADPLVHKQALAIAESLLEEIELQDAVATAPNTPVTAANRDSVYHIVSDYNGFTMNGITQMSGAAIPGLANYTATVAVLPAALGAIPAASAWSITVTVTDPQGIAIAVSGYRTAYN